QFFGLLGPNGAGKTTAISITTGLVRITSGSVRVFGYDVVRQFRQARRYIGLAPQELNFDWFFSIEELIILQAGYYGVSRQTARVRTDQLLKEFGLAEKRNVKPRELSGGQKRRLQIARALVHDPDVLILDEPTAGVDVELRYQLWEYLTQQNQAGKTIILTTHYIEEAEKLCERVAIIDHGQIITEDSPAELIAQMGKDGISLTVTGWNDRTGQALKDYPHHFADGHVRVTTAKPELQLAEVVNRIAASGAVVQDVKIERATLEDVFIELTGRSIDDT
ncbi:MAG: ABC transporter ATP-binding protein, partial [Dehalococcoidia bacterium]